MKETKVLHNYMPKELDNIEELYQIKNITYDLLEAIIDKLALEQIKEKNQREKKQKKMNYDNNIK